MAPLQGKIALVTGASRGVGQGIAMGLAEAGATVYVTGRTVAESDAVEALAGTIHSTAATLNELGGKGIAVVCDHRSDSETEALFKKIIDEQGRLDILVNNVWAGYEYSTQNDPDNSWLNPFWEQPLRRWEAMFEAGVRAHFVCSQHAAKTMVKQKSGLIVNISYWSADKYIFNSPYCVSKAACNRMAQTMAHDLANYNVAAIALYPGVVRTERVLRDHNGNLEIPSESPQFVGRAIAALANDKNVMDKNGQILIAANLAREYGFTDIDGSLPIPLTLETA